MNILLLGLVLYSYFVSSAPKVFKENKQLVLGMFIGVTIYQMNLVEGASVKVENCVKKVYDTFDCTDENWWSLYYTSPKDCMFASSHLLDDCVSPENND